ncbi:MAG: DUF2339 domain-containing protein, partial [Saprospiraceae bacterium]|nr:DUF2339 domain-containing protein [Saprospiraceae bacterium]
KLGSVIVTLLMLISISMDWHNNYLISGYFSEDYIKQLGFLFNKIFLTTLVSGVSLIAMLLLLKKEKENIAWIIPIEVYKAIILCLMFLVFYIGGLSEANYQAFHYFIEFSSKGMVASTFNALFILVLLVFAHKMNNRNISITVSILSVLFILYFLVSLSVVYAGSALIYISGSEIYSSILLVLRWVSVFAVYAIGILLFRLVNKINNNARNELYKLNIAVLIFTFLFLLSADLDTITILITKSKHILIQVHKAGYAILWGLSSFILMMIGMKKKEQFIRIISLVLFAITIIKLFVYDITNINEGGKIVAFVLLGILLLIISFMYQKVKKLLLDDDSVMKKSETEIETPKD